MQGQAALDCCLEYRQVFGKSVKRDSSEVPAPTMPRDLRGWLKLTAITLGHPDLTRKGSMMRDLQSPGCLLFWMNFERRGVF